MSQSHSGAGSTNFRDVAGAVVAIAVLTPLAAGLAIANFVLTERRAYRERQDRLARHGPPPCLVRPSARKHARIVRIFNI